MSLRENALKEWIVQTIPNEDYILKPLAGDASFRRYYRIQYQGISQIIMDAPPEKEKLEPFLYVAELLSKAKILTPKIIAKNLKQGFLLLSDFGDQLLLGALNTESVDTHYLKAINTVLKIQQSPIDDSQLPFFNKEFMLSEMSLCEDWFFKAYLNLDLKKQELELIRNTFDWIATQVSLQPLVVTHRDYHSRNLMLINSQEKEDLGVIDFQDAMRGPLTYDLVSLLKDCYISWPRENILKWVSFFHQNSPQAQNYSLDDLIRAFDLCGLQRHLKVLGIFCRLSIRDNKAGYLQNLPLVLRYVLECTETYKTLHPFFNFLQNRVHLK